MRLSHRAGGLAFCLAKLQRKTLRTALVDLSRCRPTKASDLPPLTGGLGSINAQQQLDKPLILAVSDFDLETTNRTTIKQ